MSLRAYPNKKGAPTYYIDERDGAGRRRRVKLGRYANKANAALAYADYLKDKERAGVALPTRASMTLGDLLTVWLESKRPDVTARHFGNLKAHAADLRAVLGADTPLKALDAGAAARLKTKLAVRVKTHAVKLRGGKRVRLGRKTPPVAGTINRKLQTLKAALDFAAARRWIGANPLAHVAGLSDARPPVWKWLRPDDIDRLLAVLDNGAVIPVERVRKVKVNGRRRAIRDNYETTVRMGAGLREAAIFALNTGARRGELFAVTWGDVDLAGGRVRIVGTKAAARGRSAKVRFIPLNGALRQLFERMGGAAKAGAGDTVFDPAMKPYVATRLARACRLAGIEPVRWHDLRHSFAANLASSGVSLAVIRELLGHSTFDLTTRYAHLSAGALADAVALLDFGADGSGARVVAVNPAPASDGEDVAATGGERK